MPKIRTWHRIVHDFNRDPEIQVLRKRFPEWMGYVWLEMLAVADRKGGKLKGELNAIAESLAHVSLSKRPQLAAKHIVIAFAYMSDCGWIELQTDGILVLKYGEFRGSREQIQTPSGKSKTSPQEEKRQDLLKDVGTEPTSRPAPLPPSLQGWLERTQHLKSLSNGRHAIFWQTLVDAYDSYSFLYFEDEIKRCDAWLSANPNRRPTEKGLPRFMRNWMERAVERGRKHGKGT